ncbi:GreA/GreB family elongation factor [Streptomyces sp. NBC_00328]|uniref:GreA/GreB family elongation factor n=1 Tax=Streptomyces sp. NBC_00328 TaxID=2903646 RepID=UPI002E29E6B5|nr:GreA/GreB family elongation factor [Streptomyces sp. NBC_00328]
MTAVLDRTLVTAGSPLGHALLGHRAGDTVDLQAPEGPRSTVVVSLGPHHLQDDRDRG